jgi:hypothetical protein
MFGKLARHAMAVFAAIGVISTLRGLMTIHDDLLFVFAAYQKVTHPIWDLTVGYLFRWAGWPFPAWLKNYFTMGLIAAGAQSRHLIAVDRRLERGTEWRMILAHSMLAFIIWPLALASFAIEYWIARQDPELLGRKAEQQLLGHFDGDMNQLCRETGRTKEQISAMLRKTVNARVAELGTFFELWPWPALFWR